MPQHEAKRLARRNSPDANQSAQSLALQNGIEPCKYLKDVLQGIAEGEDPALLTPRLRLAARNASDC